MITKVEEYVTLRDGSTFVAEYFPMQLVGEAAYCVERVVNQGIDARLTAFTRSTFKWYAHTPKGMYPQSEYDPGKHGPCITGKLHCAIHPLEMEVLLRRLYGLSEQFYEYENDDMAWEAETLADDICRIHYEVELLD